MNVQTIPRNALDGYLRLLRLPANAVVRALGGRHGGTSAAELVLDRADAAVRDAVGQVLNDSQLRDDARRRRAAADERERALKLRAEAERTSQQADATMADRQDAAEEKRRAAAKLEQQKKARAQQERAATSRKLAGAEERRQAAVRAEAKRAEEAIEDRSRRSRLAQLDTEAVTLAEEEEALTARSEAQRLRRAAGETKAARKSGS